MGLWIEQRRGELRETRHPVSARVVEAGTVRWQVGEDVACFWRSGCKAFQLRTALAQLPSESLEWLSDADLAIGAASHSGQPEHLARVRRILRHFSVHARLLRCGAHLPIHLPSAHKLLGRRQKPTALHNNCSGKHTFMLAACRAQGWSTDYLPAAHPLQVLNLSTITELAGQSPGTAVDGCGVPTFHLPISAMARAYATLAAAMAGDGDALLGRIGRAMGAFPELTSGTGRLDLAVVRAATEPISVKIGAEGLFDIALPARRLGVVIKVHSGNSEALAVAVAAVMAEVAPGALGDWTPAEAVVLNVAGREVGERRAVWAAD